jgi:PAS domain S-box-containing protein/putative nucleotidyltransferase with HDIG domain
LNTRPAGWGTTMFPNYPYVDDKGEVTHAVVLSYDLTERKTAELALRESESRYRTLFDNANDAIFLMREELFIDCNPKTLEMFCCTRDQIIHQPPYRFSPPLQPDGSPSREKALEKIGAALRGEPQFFEWLHCWYDGTPFAAEVSLNTVSLDGETFIQAIVRDVNSRKQAELALQRSEQKYRSIVENAVEGIFQSTPEGTHIMVNPAHARMYGYDSPEEMMAAVTNVQDQLYVDPEERRRLLELLEKEGVVRDYEAQLYHKNGKRIWISTNARAVKDDAGKVLYYEGTTEDITARRVAEAEMRETSRKLRKSLMGTIEAMSMTVETRDPYTAGHQKRVARLARAIAEKMDLPENMIDMINMAGAIHDIGKMSVPSEILAKPAKLSDMERNLINVHPQSGYDILKNAELPFPVAEIVLQHHERLDGSGYPRGLKGEEILLEAAILAVADVVEAVSSHRPYRPANGVPAALEEIEKYRGLLYSTDAVDICLKLFREQGFDFE